MMNTSDINAIRELWRRYVCEESMEERLISQLFEDGGFDFSDVANSDIRNILRGHTPANWERLCFAFSEILAFYNAKIKLKSELAPIQVITWYLSVLVVADAIKSDKMDIEMQFNKIVDVFTAIRYRLEMEESLHLFRRLFSGVA